MCLKLGVGRECFCAVRPVAVARVGFPVAMFVRIVPCLPYGGLALCWRGGLSSRPAMVVLARVFCFIWTGCLRCKVHISMVVAPIARHFVCVGVFGPFCECSPNAVFFGAPFGCRDASADIVSLVDLVGGS